MERPITCGSDADVSDRPNRVPTEMANEAKSVPCNQRCGTNTLSLKFSTGLAGSAFRALRDNQPLAASRGIGRVKYQILVFGLSGFFTGLMGVLYAGHFRVIGTNMLDFELLFFLFTMLAVGGLGSRWGPLIGGIAIMLANEVMKEFGEWRMVAFGGITVLFMVAFRQGLVGMANDLWLKWGKPRTGKNTAQANRSEAD